VLNKMRPARPVGQKACVHAHQREDGGLGMEANLKDAFIEHVQALQEGMAASWSPTRAMWKRWATPAKPCMMRGRPDQRVSGELLATDLRRAQHHLGGDHRAHHAG
jgi:hypothetical protein